MQTINFYDFLYIYQLIYLRIKLDCYVTKWNYVIIYSDNVMIYIGF